MMDREAMADRGDDGETDGTAHDDAALRSFFALLFLHFFSAVFVSL